MYVLQQAWVYEHKYTQRNWVRSLIKTIIFWLGMMHEKKSAILASLYFLYNIHTCFDLHCLCFNVAIPLQLEKIYSVIPQSVANATVCGAVETHH